MLTLGLFRHSLNVILLWRQFNVSVGPVGLSMVSCQAKWSKNLLSPVLNNNLFPSYGFDVWVFRLVLLLLAALFSETVKATTIKLGTLTN